MLFLLTEAPRSPETQIEHIDLLISVVPRSPLRFLHRPLSMNVLLEQRQRNRDNMRKFMKRVSPTGDRGTEFGFVFFRS